MQVLARLVHAEPGTRVVEVTAQHEGQTLGSALGEGATAEAAEERALQRLRQRLGLRPEPGLDQGQAGGADGTAPGSARPVQKPAAPAAAPPRQAAGPAAQAPAQSPAAGEPAAPASAPETKSQEMRAPEETAPAEEPPPDPEDWSGELAQIDLQLQRIGWQRDQGAIYLGRAFGHPSRARITTYRDLMAYLEVLQGLASGSDPAQAPVPLRRPELLGQCDQLLARLGWDAARGRRFLERHFGLASRQQLSDSQLLQFNMLLEEALLEPAAPEPPSAGAGG
jgi:hypothetical protein